MPYIQQSEREAYDIHIQHLQRDLEDIAIRPGHFNYVITKLLAGSGPFSYNYINAAIGVLECVKAEFYRRLAAPYEDEKQQINGDVYGTCMGVWKRAIQEVENFKGNHTCGRDECCRKDLARELLAIFKHAKENP